jgi:hypothetical protein
MTITSANDSLNLNQIIDSVKSNDNVSEVSVLIREINVSLNAGNYDFKTSAKIKIYLSSSHEKIPFYFELSHYIKTEIDLSAYIPGDRNSDSEEEAIRKAINALTQDLVAAIKSGKQPSEDWLVPNKDF